MKNKDNLNIVLLSMLAAVPLGYMLLQLEKGEMKFAQRRDALYGEVCKCADKNKNGILEDEEVSDLCKRADEGWYPGLRKNPQEYFTPSQIQRVAESYGILNKGNKIY